VVATSALGHTRPDDVYIAYLPLAHVLELLAEFSFMILGEQSSSSIHSKVKAAMSADDVQSKTLTTKC